MNIRYASLTDVGVKRSHNQDAVASHPAADDAHWRSHGHVFIVADGMGGHAVGEMASAKAVRDIPLTYLKHVAADGAAAALRRAFEEANAAIHQIGVNNPEFKNLGTTGTAIILRPEGAWVGHVGDSRCYRVRDDRVQQLTFDHSWVWEVARRQGIDPDDLGDFKKNVIIRSIGPDTAVEVDVEGPHPLRPGDTFVVCSDGLTNEVTADELGAVCRAFPPEEASRYLVDLANVRGGKDNVTCLVVQVPADAAGFDRVGGGGPLRAAGRVAGAVTRVVPWPFLALGAGATAAAASVAAQSQGERWLAVPAFAAAAGLILLGLVGLYVHLKRKADRADATETTPVPGQLNLYRDYQVEFSATLAERFARLDADLAGQCVGNPELEIDWAAHEQLNRDADARAAKGDWAETFAARFRAMHLLAAAVHKARGKGEGFSPNYSR